MLEIHPTSTTGKKTNTWHLLHLLRQLLLLLLLPRCCLLLSDGLLSVELHLLQLLQGDRLEWQQFGLTQDHDWNVLHRQLPCGGWRCDTAGLMLLQCRLFIQHWEILHSHSGDSELKKKICNLEGKV